MTPPPQPLGTALWMYGCRACMALATSVRIARCTLSCLSHFQNGVNYVPNFFFGSHLQSETQLLTAFWTGTKWTLFLKGQSFPSYPSDNPLCPFSASECLTKQTCIPQGRNCRHACYLGGAPSPAVPRLCWTPACFCSRKKKKKLLTVFLSTVQCLLSHAAISFSSSSARCWLNSLCCAHEILWCILFFSLLPLAFSICHPSLSVCAPLALSCVAQSLLVPGKSPSKYGRRGSAIGIGTIEEVDAYLSLSCLLMLSLVFCST